MRINQGDVAVVTGAGSGIGRACALEFARLGCSLVLGDVDGEAAERCARLTSERFGVAASGVACDVRSDDEMKQLFARAASEFGRADIALLNAGIGYYARVEETPAEEFRHLFDVNVLGVQRGIVEAAPRMRAQGHGAIVIVGSVNGLIGWPLHGAYAATKFALTGLAHTLQMELAGSGVLCTLVLPANVRTRFYTSARAANGYLPRPIGGRDVSAEHVARAVIRGIQRDAAEVYAAPPMVAAGARAGRLLPGLARRAGKRWDAKA